MVIKFSQCVIVVQIMTTSWKTKHTFTNLIIFQYFSFLHEKKGVKVNTRYYNCQFCHIVYDIKITNAIFIFHGGPKPILKGKLSQEIKKVFFTMDSNPYWKASYLIK